MSEALVKIEGETALERPSPRAVIAAATEEANVLAEVVNSRGLYATIQGRKFVRVEGWVTLATLRGCLPREVRVTEMPEGRYVAEVELVRMSDGMVLTRASAECGGEDDNVWRARPANARRSMAITRATGKACRVAFSWVMALAGFEVTPAEEMDHVLRQEETKREAIKADEKKYDETPVGNTNIVDNFVLNFGKHRGKKIADVDNSYLDWLILEVFEKAIKDPEKAQYKTDNERKMRACLALKIERAKNAIPNEDELPFGPAHD